jgi:hypothetical protein
MSRKGKLQRVKVAKEALNSLTLFLFSLRRFAIPSCDLFAKRCTAILGRLIWGSKLKGRLSWSLRSTVTDYLRK